ncbi:MAG: hypothetical protein WAO71_12635 [Gallionella sp.]
MNTEKNTSQSTTVLHHDQRIKKLQEFRLQFVNDYQEHSNEALYSGCLKTIESIYGETGFAAVALNRNLRHLSVIFSNMANFSLDSLAEEIKVKVRDNDTVPRQSNDKQFVLFTITAESGWIANFIIIKFNQQVIKSDIDFIQELASLIGFKQTLRIKWSPPSRQSFIEFKMVA